MNIFQAILDRRSIREFKPDPIPEDVLERLLEAMHQAPSGKNAQPWKFIVVKDKILKEKIASACTFFTSSGREINQAWIAQAPVIIVACGDQKDAFVKIVKDGQVHIVNWDSLQQELEKGPVEWESGLRRGSHHPAGASQPGSRGRGIGRMLGGRVERGQAESDPGHPC